jgi:DNA-binding response OmpR family regulator
MEILIREPGWTIGSRSCPPCVESQSGSNQPQSESQFLSDQSRDLFEQMWVAGEDPSPSSSSQRMLPQLLYRHPGSVYLRLGLLAESEPTDSDSEQAENHVGQLRKPTVRDASEFPNGLGELFVSQG